MALSSKPQDRGSAGGEIIAPAKLALQLDPGIFQNAFTALGQMLAEESGMDAYLDMLRDKVALFQGCLGREELAHLDLERLEHLVERMFTVRRRLWSSLQQMAPDVLADAIRDLLYGHGHVAARMQRFGDSIPAEGKVKRSVRDFAAELLHYNDPERYPLMDRWVWDQGTQSGALREFVRGNDHLQDVPFGESPEVFEGARQWVMAQLSEQGVYRDLPLMADLLFAYQYSEYLRAMAEGFLRSDFGGNSDPAEHIKKLLGIDSRRRQGTSRVKKETLH